MRKIKYLIQCVLRMNFGRMFKTAHRLAKENRKLSVGILFDMLWCGLRYGAGYVDYQIFDFVRLSAKQRKTFVTRGCNNEFIRKLNNKDDYHKFENKTVFNTLFEKFIGRDWICLSDCTVDEFAAFLKNHSAVIAKPIDAICGKGIDKITVGGGFFDSPATVRELYDRLISNGQLLLEEYIIQHGDVAAINPDSVNTIRLMTIVSGEDVHIMFRALRVGIAGSVVDNFNAGGMFVLLNEQGVISSHAINKNTDVFERHPSTGIVFKGTAIPFFNEVEKMIKEAAKVVPGIRYVSWDIAVTPNGPVLVEGNHNPGYDLLQSKVYLTDNDYGRLDDFKRVINA